MEIRQFTYIMADMNYNRNPDTVQYIIDAKTKSQKSYKTLYKDYLALRLSNFAFKVVFENDELTLYSNTNPNGDKWEKVAIDDYVLSINNTNSKTLDYKMSEIDFSNYKNNIIGAIMADIDYADDNRLVFHYLNGFFVYNINTKTFEQKIDISKLNIAPHQQGSNGLDVKISQDGSIAYLTSYGPSDEIAGFENYTIDLNKGKVTKGNITSEFKEFNKYKLYSDIFKQNDGWPSNLCVLYNEYYYYLVSKVMS